MDTQVTTKMKKAYIICATDRSGSTLLCDLLSRTGLAGNRVGEYLNSAEDEEVPSCPAGHEAYLEQVRQAIQSHASDNGVSGVKMSWWTLRDVIERLRGKDRTEPVDDIEVLQSAFPDVAFIHISRRDKVRQAISFDRAHSCGEWGRTTLTTSKKPPGSRYRLSPWRVERFVQRVAEEEDLWDSFFEKSGITVHRVEYERMVADRDTAIRDCLRFLGVSVADDFKAPLPGQIKQSDFYNRLWLCYYLVYGFAKRLCPPRIRCALRRLNRALIT